MTDIAIVGMAGRFPGAPDVDALWELVRDGREGLVDLDDADLLAAGVDPDTIADPDYVKRAGVLAEVDCFDAALFGIGPGDAAVMDPQHRLLLECAWATLEASGHVPGNFPGSVGVFAGCGPNTYLLHNLLTRPEVVERLGWFLLRHTGNDKDFLSTGISYRLDLRGPSVAVQTACSTSLVAVHMAAQSLLSLECDMALAGGVTVDVPHGVGYRYAEGEVVSPEGKCRPFDIKSAGTVLGSGVGMVALRRLEDAEVDGDTVLAVIKGTAVNNDGTRKVGYLAPSVDGHIEVAREALAVAGVDPATVGLLEAHGTGTAVGDPIEVAALTEAYAAGEERGWCRLASTKANIGHCDTAAGIASLISAVQALRHRWLPPLAGFTAPNPLLDLDRTPFHLSSTGSAWPAGATPRRAAVSNLGIGGTNAHVVLEEAAEPRRGPSGGPALLLVSAATADGADAAVTRLSRYLGDRPTTDRPAAAHTLLTGRRRFAQRRALVADSGGTASIGVSDGPDDAAPRVVFCFPGGGSGYPGMAAGLLVGDSRFDTFRSAFQEVRTALADHGGPDVAHYLDPGADAAAMRRTTVSLPTVLAVELALARQLLAWGITPAATLGHSLGEYSAAHLAGVLDLDGLAKLVVCRSQLVERVSGAGGAMAAVSMSERDLLPYLGAELSLAAVNAPDECTVSGPVHAVDELQRRLESRESVDAAVHRLGLAAAGHSSLLDPVLEEFASVAAQVPLRAPTSPYITNVTGRWATAEDLADPRWWVRHLRGTVRFADGLATALGGGPTILLEVGPGHALSSYAGLSEPGPVASVPMMRHPTESGPDDVHLLGALGRGWTVGMEADWASVVAPPGPRRQVPLPGYPFARTKHWIGPPIQAASRAARRGPRPLDSWASEPVWEPVPTDPAHAGAGQGRWAVTGAPGDALVTGITAELARRGVRLTDSVEQPTCVAVVASPADRIDTAGLDIDQFEAALSGARAVAATGAEGARLGVVTRGLWTGHRAAAGLAIGPALVLGSEVPEAVGIAIDVAPRGDTPDHSVAEADIRRVVDALLADDGGLLSVRAGVAYRQVLRPVSFEPPARPPVAPGGSWLVTGGLGGVGAALARHLASVHGCSIVVTTASALPSDPSATRRRLGAHHPSVRRLDRLARLRATGVHVRVEQADVTDPGAVAALLDRLAGDGVVLDGVIHAAGAIADRPLTLLTQADIDRATRAKAGGALTLVTELEARGVANLVLVSSTSTQLCPAGQAAYISANSVLDALAGDHGDLRVVTVNWGVWEGDGGAAAAADRALGTSGTGPITSWSALQHPILHEVGIGRGGSLVALGALTTECWAVSEHRLLDGTAVLPGTALLELPLATLAAGGEPLAVLSGAVLLAPLMVPDPDVVAIRVVVDPAVNSAPGGRRAVRVEARRRGTGWVTHLEAEVGGVCSDLPSEPAVEPTPESVSDVLVGQRRHFQFGSHWDGLRQAARGAVEAVAVAPAVESDEGWLLHPATVDLGIALGVGLLDGDGLWVPAAVESVTGTRRMGVDGTDLHVRRRVCEGDPDVAILDVSVGGAVCLGGLTMRRLASGAQLNAAQPETALPTLAPVLELARAGGIRSEQGGEALDRVLATGRPRLVVSNVELAALSDSPAPPPPPAPRTAPGEAGSTLAAVTQAWEDLLGFPVGPDDDFFQIGGNSLHAVRIVARLRRRFGVRLGSDALLRTPTPTSLAAAVDETNGATPRGPRCLIPIKATGHRRPLFMMHGAGGSVLNFSTLARELPADRPLYGLQARGSDGLEEMDQTIEEMAARYVAAIRTVQPRGPYLLGGYSGGGIIALEMTRQLGAAGDHTDVIVMFDTFKPIVDQPSSARKILNLAWNTRNQGIGATNDWFRDWVRRRLARAKVLDQDLAQVDLTDEFRTVVGRYRFGAYPVDVVLLKAAEVRPIFISDYDWDGIITGHLEVRPIAGHHERLFAPAHSAALAAAVVDALEPFDR